MATIKGQNLRIFFAELGSTPICIGAATNSVLHVAAQLAEDTCKDVVDDWLDQEIVGLSWDVSADALVLLDDSGAWTIDGLLDAIKNKTVFYLKMSTAGSDENRTSLTNMMGGKVIITDILVNAQAQDISTYTIKMIGTADLTILKKLIASYQIDYGSVIPLTGDSITFQRTGGNFEIKFNLAGADIPSVVQISNRTGNPSVEIQNNYVKITFFSSFQDTDFTVTFITSNNISQTIAIHIT